MAWAKLPTEVPEPLNNTYNFFVYRVHMTPLTTTKQAHKNQSNLALISRLKCAAGLAEMEGRKYKNAARYFLQISFDHFQCADVSFKIFL